MRAILGLSGTAITKLIKKGEVSAVDVMEQALNQVDTVQPLLNPFVTIAQGAALAPARQADELLSKTQPETLPAFFGVPFNRPSLLSDNQSGNSTME